ncbi:MAG: hypothetical protein ACI9J3_003583 [Parvicellaceae bacterium]|jgi:uncharacterized protein (TIGR02145 family)
MDKAGNEYNTVKIGSQWWMAENLRTTKFSDGSAITYAASNAAWDSLTAGGYSFYDTKGRGYSTYSQETYGALYNWHAVNDSKGLCPSGWHVPRDDVTGGYSEWQTLENYLGPNAGTKLKTISGWYNASGDFTNGGDYTSGFLGLPGGYRNTSGGFFVVGLSGYWWSASEYTTNAWFRILYYDNGVVVRYDATKELGLSVRCLRD